MAFHAKLPLIAALVAAVAGAGCSSDSNTGSSGSSNKVTALASLAFSPTSLSVATGDSVTWVFQSVGHTVTFDSATAGVPANIGSVGSPESNVSVTRTFTTPGTYTYHCSIHTFMTGSITVGSSVVQPPAAPPPPPPSNPYGSVRH